MTAMIFNIAGDLRKYGHNYIAILFPNIYLDFAIRASNLGEE